MKKQILFGVLTLSVLVILLGAGAGIVAAQGPANDSFNTAAYLFDTKLETIPAKASRWYRFDYGGDRSSIFLTMPNGTNSGLDFRIFTPDQIAHLVNYPDEETFIGRGTAVMVRCDTGRCASNELTWVGSFPVAGTYYVKVVSSNTGTAAFRFLIQGTNITLGPPAGLAPPDTPTPTPPADGTTASATTVAVATPVTPPGVSAAVATPVSPPQNDSPYTATYIRDNQDLPIAANSAVWHNFDYGGDRSDIDITLINGNKSGLQFMVYAPEQATQYVLYQVDTPVGRGNVSQVTSDDLTWHGAFNAPGTYFVKVLNPTTKPMTFRLMIRGTNITIQ